MTPEQVARRFIEAINGHDMEGIVALMSEDHRFIDSGGAVYTGRDTMKQGWIGYFSMVPDYLISVSETLVSGDTVALFGTASGTYTADGKLVLENRWETPAAWRAVIAGDKVKEWQVYADNEPIRAIIRRH